MNAKRKRVVEDSEDDDFSDSSPDAKLARRLQDEEDRRVSEVKSTPASSSHGTRRSKRATLSNSFSFQDSDVSVDEPLFTEPVSKGSARRGKAAAKNAAHPAKATTGKGKSVISDSDDIDDIDLELKSEDDDDDFSPVPPPRRRTRTKSSAQVKASETAKKGASRKAIPEPDVEDMEDSGLDGGVDGYASDPSSALDSLASMSGYSAPDDGDDDDDDEDPLQAVVDQAVHAANTQRRGYSGYKSRRRTKNDRARLESHHPELKTMWIDLENMPLLKAGKAEQPKSISRLLKPFQLEGLAWMKEMEKTKWKGGLLGDEMGLGKTIQAVSLIMSDFPQKQPSLVLVPPVALMQWTNEIKSYTDGTLETLVMHGTNAKAKNLTVAELKKYDVIIMSYNSLESMYRKQEKGFKRKEGVYKEDSAIHQILFHRVIVSNIYFLHRLLNIITRRNQKSK
jgi:DNA repair protein RAD16